jgi:hypothetical protein
MSWIPKSDNLFLNSLYQDPSLLMKNLHKLSEIQSGDKLYFYPDGRIEREPDSITRSSLGIFNRYVFGTTERDITHLEKFAGAFWFYYRVHVIPFPSLHDVIYTIGMAISGLKRLQGTYELQDRKQQNIEIVAKAIDTLQTLSPHMIEESTKKCGTPLNIYTKNYAFLVTRLNPIKDQLSKIMPLIDDSGEDILAIQNDPLFLRIRKIYDATHNLFTTEARKEALAKIILKECSDMNSIVKL